MIDWAAARLDYISHHELTYVDIANKYHASRSTIWNRAAREHWTEQRKTASEKLVEKIGRELLSASLSNWHTATSVIWLSLKNLKRQ